VATNGTGFLEWRDMSEIGISYKDFSQKLDDIGRGVYYDTLEPLSKYSSTYQSAVKPNELIKQLNEMIGLYLCFLKMDTEKAKELGQKLVQADQLLSGNTSQIGRNHTGYSGHY
jgi:hypothetical protein